MGLLPALEVGSRITATGVTRVGAQWAAVGALKAQIAARGLRVNGGRHRAIARTDCRTQMASATAPLSVDGGQGIWTVARLARMASAVKELEVAKGERTRSGAGGTASGEVERGGAMGGTVPRPLGTSKGGIVGRGWVGSGGGSGVARRVGIGARGGGRRDVLEGMAVGGDLGPKRDGRTKRIGGKRRKGVVNGANSADGKVPERG
ncbi:unnamed protein product [Ostreobium quekettii]|uniref:Uncharacterized protein n=1 Tax=Ostreobium quekettii TaxID=121088 RepID=A0A8S1IMW0_9CHLO|nr:unnamed protein product [Ostreobium quekettii]|eukprot:evm.model.scf_1438.4 EVM.evm.TU.scf_1438.4   scf_1438:25182-25799(-)